MSESYLCSFPTSSAAKSSQSAHTLPETVAIGSSLAEKMAQSPHNAVPSTSTANTALFSAQRQLMSPQSTQAMANTFLSQNPFLNPAFNQLAAFASHPDISHVQQWLQQNSPYTSPTPSSTPSLISNLSGLSIFSADSSFTLNSHNHQLNSSFVNAEELNPSINPQKFLSYFLEAAKDYKDQELFLHSLKSLRMFANGIAKKKIPTEFNQKDLRELIKILIQRLASPKEEEYKWFNYLLEVLDSLFNQQQFDLAITEYDTEHPILPVFACLLQRITSSGDRIERHRQRALQTALVILHRCLTLIKNKSAIRNEQFFNVLLSVLKLDVKCTLKFVALGILRCLIHGEEKWKQFVFEREIIELMYKIMETGNRKLFGQSLRVFNTLLDSKDSRYAEGFVKSGGIKNLMRKIASLMTDCSEDDFVKPLNCLKLISDARALSEQNLSLAINFAIRGTFPSQDSKPNVYWTNTLNALAFLRNAIVLNEKARDYLALMEGGRAVQHFVDLSRQCIHETDMGEAVTEKVNQMKRTMLEDSLVILAALCKEMKSEKGGFSEGQKNVAKIIANNETILLIYQTILRMDTASVFKLQKMVLLSLNRITKSGALPTIFDRGPHLSETLLNFLSSHFDSTDIAKLHLIKMSAEVLYRLIDVPDRRNLDIILSSVKSRAEFRPFELLHSFTSGGNSDSDLYLAMLKIIKELCKREPVLKSQWSNVHNVQFLNSISTMSNNNKIAGLCADVLEMLQMGEDQFQDTLFCDIFMNECTETHN